MRSGVTDEARNEERLNALASETGRTKTALAREAIIEYIVEYIDDLEDYYLAEARARQNRKEFVRERRKTVTRPSVGQRYVRSRLALA